MIDANAVYDPRTVIEMGFITNTKLEPSLFTLYRIIKRGQLKALNLGTDVQPRYAVKGSDLRDFVKKRYNI